MTAAEFSTPLLGAELPFSQTHNLPPLGNHNLLELARRDPVYVILLMDAPESFEPATLVAAARQCALRDPASLASGIRNFRIRDEQLRFELACICADLDGLFTAINIRNFGLEDSRRRLEVSIRCARGPDGSPLYAENFDLNGAEAEQAAVAYAVQCPGAVIRHHAHLGLSDPEALRRVYIVCLAQDWHEALAELSEQRPEFQINAEVTQAAFIEALRRGNLRNASMISSAAAGQAQLALDEEAQFLAYLDRVLVQERGGSIDQRTVDILKWMQQAGLFPASGIFKAFRHFGDGAHDFLRELIDSRGAHFAERVLQALVGSYPVGDELEAADRTMVRRYLETEFAGFSERSFALYRQAYQHSPSEALQLVARWSALASQVLSFKELDDSIVQWPLFTELIYSVYRPFSLSMERVRWLLDNTYDRELPPQIAPLPAEGVELLIGEAEDVHEADGARLDYQRIQELVAAVRRSTENLPGLDDLMPSLICALQGRHQQVRLDLLLSYLGCNPQQLHLHAVCRELADMADHLPSVEWAYHTLLLLSELTGSLAPDACHSIFPVVELAAEQSAALQRAARQAGLALDEPDRSEAAVVGQLAIKLSEVFRRQHAVVQAELDKITVGQTRGGGKRLRAYTPVVNHAVLARAGARLCEPDDPWSWEQDDSFFIVLVDPVRRRMAGVIQLHLFDDAAGSAALLARVHPNSELLRRVDGQTFAGCLVRFLSEYAALNGRRLYFPEQDDSHALTQRELFYPHLAKYLGESQEACIQILRNLVVTRVFAVEAPSSNNDVSI